MLRSLPPQAPPAQPGQRGGQRLAQPAGQSLDIPALGPPHSSLRSRGRSSARIASSLPVSIRRRSSRTTESVLTSSPSPSVSSASARSCPSHWAPTAPPGPARTATAPRASLRRRPALNSPAPTTTQEVRQSQLSLRVTTVICRGETSAPPPVQHGTSSWS